MRRLFALSKATRLASGEFFCARAMARSSVASGLRQQASALWPLVPHTLHTSKCVFLGSPLAPLSAMNAAALAVLVTISSAAAGGY